MKITDEMVEKAFDTYWEKVDDRISWDGLRIAIEAIAPLIRSAALEEAARVADERADQCAEGYAERGQFFRPDPHREAEHIAKAIRALKDKDDRTPTEGDLL